MRIKEKELLSRSQLQQAAEAHSLAAAIAALRDSSYGPYLTGSSGNGDFAAALERALNGAYDYVMDIAPEHILLTAFRARHDFHNVKVMVKAVRGTASGYERAFSNTGSFGPGELRDTLAGGEADFGLGDRPDLRAVMKALYETNGEAMELVAGSGSCSPATAAFLVDSLVDASYYRWASSVYRKHGHPGLKEFFSAEIDQLNMRVAYRASRLRLEASLYRSMVLPGGTVGAGSLSLAYQEGVLALAALYKGTSWEPLAERGARLIEKGEPLAGWERSCDDALMSIVKKARFYPLGPEPVYGFMFAKEAEARNLRVIFSGKQSAIGSREISGRLRDPYV